MILVPDASVILKWVLEKASEPDQVAIRLLTLWRYEVGNVWGLKQSQLAHELFSVLIVYDFEEVSLGKGYAVEVLGHMREVKGVTFYDSAYPVLAIPMKGLYLTADHAYVNKAKQKCHVTLLSEWKGV